MRSGIGAWVAVLCLVVQTPCFADQEASASVPPTITPPAAAEATGSSSSSSASYFKGLADSKSNLIAARYKERLNNFRSQIENAISKGWLTADESEMFRNQVVALTYLENEVSQKGYPKEDLDDLEQRFNEFNRRLSQTMVKGTPKPPPVTTDSVSAPVAVQNQPQPGDVGATTLPATKPAPAPVKKPAAKKPAAQKPAAKKPAAKKPAVKKPAAKKPAVKKPAAKKPAAKKPAAKKPAA